MFSFKPTFALLSVATVISAQASSLRPRELNEGCGSFKACYLKNVNTGKMFYLSGETAGLQFWDDGLDEHTIVCETEGNIAKVSFTYSGETHEDFEAPWTMANEQDEVSYLMDPGSKKIVVLGETLTEPCFKATISFGVEIIEERRALTSKNDEANATAVESNRDLNSHVMYMVTCDGNGNCTVVDIIIHV